MTEISNIANLRIGQRVHYQPEHYGDTRWENGMIKEIREGTLDSVWVVYNCAGNWGLFKCYTSAKTNLRDLKFDWRFE